MVHVGINLANYDGCLLSCRSKKKKKKRKVEGMVINKMCLCLFRFSWIHIGSVAECNLTLARRVFVFCALGDLSLLSSPAFDEAPGSKGFALQQHGFCLVSEFVETKTMREPPCRLLFIWQSKKKL